MPFLPLPNELLVMVASYREYERDLDAFSRASKQFYPAVSPIMRRNNIHSYNSSGLFWTAEHGQTITAERFLQHGANVNIHNDRALPLLWYAIGGGHSVADR
ncbi:hypothetical protein BJX65DRAFT_314480 [Aspergillus insuetus]